MRMQKVQETKQEPTELIQAIEQDNIEKPQTNRNKLSYSKFVLAAQENEMMCQHSDFSGDATNDKIVC